MDFDFNIILVPATLILGFIWLLDKLWLKQHSQGRVTASDEYKQAQLTLQKHKQAFIDTLSQHNIAVDDVDELVIDDAPVAVKQAQREYRDAKRYAYVVSEKHKPKQAHFLVRWSHDYFIVLLVVLVVRSFLIEPFNIPSSSMVPSLYTGDFVAVNKYAYGLRLPLLNTKIIDTGSPERGDVVVFRFPKNPKTYYIKRVIGLPGDTVSYQQGKLFINGNQVPSSQVEFTADEILTERLYTPIKSASGQGWDLSPIDAMKYAQIEESGAQYFKEQLGEHTYLRRYLNPSIKGSDYSELLNKQLSSEMDWSVTVPENNYFMMGDNTDRSQDSRYWGFVPDANLSGKAVYVWMHKQPGLSNLPTFAHNRSID